MLRSLPDRSSAFSRIARLRLAFGSRTACFARCRTGARPWPRGSLGFASPLDLGPLASLAAGPELGLWPRGSHRVGSLAVGSESWSKILEAESWIEREALSAALSPDGCEHDECSESQLRGVDYREDPLHAAAGDLDDGDRPRLTSASASPPPPPSWSGPSPPPKPNPPARSRVETPNTTRGIVAEGERVLNQKAAAGRADNHRRSVCCVCGVGGGLSARRKAWTPADCWTTSTGSG